MIEYELSVAVACKHDEILSLGLFGSCPKLVELSSRIENIKLFFRPMPLATFDLIFHFFFLFVVLFQPHWPAYYSCNSPKPLLSQGLCLPFPIFLAILPDLLCTFLEISNQMLRGRMSQITLLLK